ncbi:hypothetical protein SAMN05444372_10965 [Flavobacterium micromati]|uniref:Uncharacterized protein n=1 Tax=Flavobacterium micromati TaxID=229205 RepID=A0A1M5M6A2_9FLAO|nr:hypothetical protein [Flavobacterium micromati]SHG72821.1 hypothetical protein SAMN05444372_10965 [Flavobacterium micromati]
MKNNQIAQAKEQLKAYKKAQEEWEKRKLVDVNSLSFDNDCADLIITNSFTYKANEPLQIRVFNNKESINIGCLIIPNQFEETNTKEQFTADYKSIGNHFDALLLMTPNSNFTDLGFKKMVSNDKDNSMSHYRNSCFDFEAFKNVFKPKSIVLMGTSVAFGFDRAGEATKSVFSFHDFLKNKNMEIRNTMVCISYGTAKCSNDELNDIGKYSHRQIKRGYSLICNTFEDLSLENKIRVSGFIGCFDSVE